MTYMVHNQQTIIDAILARLVAQSSRPVGDAEAPTDNTRPYAVLYPLGDDPDPDTRGTLSDPVQSTVIEFQITSVGDTRQSAQFMANHAAATIVGWSPTVAGYSFGPISREAGADAPRRDESSESTLFYQVDRYSVFVN